MGLKRMSKKLLNRRDFAGSIVAGTAHLIVVATADATQEKKLEESKPPSLVDRQLDLVQQTYPDKRLDAAALAEIREDLEIQMVRSALLSKFPLTNGDEPGYVVKAWRKGE
jgi:hypothetical protein